MENEPIIDDAGNKFWYKDNVLHRLDGPAIEWHDGVKWWCQDGLFHRLDGPAYDCDLNQQWYYKGKHIKVNSQKEFEKWCIFKLFE